MSFDSKRQLRRKIAALTAEVDLRKAETRSARLDCGQERREKAAIQRTAEHIGDDRIASEKRLFAAQLSIAARDTQLDDWSSIAIVQAERHGRLIRAIVRYRAEAGVLRAEVAKLRAGAGVPDRAVDPAVPTPALLRVTRERDAARAQLLKLQDRCDAYQRASEAEYKQLADMAGTWTTRPAVQALAS